MGARPARGVGGGDLGTGKVGIFKVIQVLDERLPQWDSVAQEWWQELESAPGNTAAVLGRGHDSIGWALELRMNLASPMRHRG